jgi:hypothetical protein
MQQESKRSSKVVWLGVALGLAVALGLPGAGSAARVQSKAEMVENCRLVAQALGNPPGCQRQCEVATRVRQGTGAESKPCA